MRSWTRRRRCLRVQLGARRNRRLGGERGSLDGRTEPPSSVPHRHRDDVPAQLPTGLPDEGPHFTHGAAGPANLVHPRHRGKLLAGDRGQGVSQDHPRDRLRGADPKVHHRAEAPAPSGIRDPAVQGRAPIQPVCVGDQPARHAIGLHRSQDGAARMGRLAARSYMPLSSSQHTRSILGSCSVCLSLTWSSPI